jgi:hypothetical protein
MQEGYVIDASHGGRLLRTRWAAGPPVKSMLQGLKVNTKELIDTVTFRCPRCGWLIWFAPEPGAEE